jgi:hypothetical protein
MNVLYICLTTDGSEKDSCPFVDIFRLQAPRLLFSPYILRRED